MGNKLLITTFETVLIVAVGIAVLIFAYLLLGKLFYVIGEKIKNKQSKKTMKKALEESGEITPKEEKKPEKKNEKYTEILDKVHQNRQQYFTENNATENGKAAPSQEEPASNNELDLGLAAEDYDVVEQINFENEDFGRFDAEPYFQEDFTSKPDVDFASEFKRKRIIKRNQTIGKEISGCSNRIKAIITLDILNKRKF